MLPLRVLKETEKLTKEQQVQVYHLNSFSRQGCESFLWRGPDGIYVGFAIGSHKYSTSLPCLGMQTQQEVDE